MTSGKNANAKRQAVKVRGAASAVKKLSHGAAALLDLPAPNQPARTCLLSCCRTVALFGLTPAMAKKRHVEDALAVVLGAWGAAPAKSLERLKLEILERSRTSTGRPTLQLSEEDDELLISYLDANPAFRRVTGAGGHLWEKAARPKSASNEPGSSRGRASPTGVQTRAEVTSVVRSAAPPSAPSLAGWDVTVAGAQGSIVLRLDWATKGGASERQQLVLTGSAYLFALLARDLAAATSELTAG